MTFHVQYVASKILKRLHIYIREASISRYILQSHIHTYKLDCILYIKITLQRLLNEFQEFL